MAIIIDNEEYLTVKESTQFLDIVADTLRNRAKAMGVKRYHQKGISPNTVYYRKKDIESMKQMHVMEEDAEPEAEPAHTKET